MICHVTQSDLIHWPKKHATYGNLTYKSFPTWLRPTLITNASFPFPMPLNMEGRSRVDESSWSSRKGSSFLVSTVQAQWWSRKLARRRYSTQVGLQSSNPNVATGLDPGPCLLYCSITDFIRHIHSYFMKKWKAINISMLESWVWQTIVTFSSPINPYDHRLYFKPCECFFALEMATLTTCTMIHSMMKIRFLLYQYIHYICVIQ